jgi:sec-independent protein translocase protein TatB
MFDLDSGKLLIIGIVALVVIGPKELPGVMRQVGQAISKLRRMASEFQHQFMDAMRESEIDDLKKDVEKFSKIGDFDGLDPFNEVNAQLTSVRADVETALGAPVTPVASAELPAPVPSEATDSAGEPAAVEEHPKAGAAPTGGAA